MTKIPKKSLYFLTIFLFIGIFLRVLYFHDLTFGYDQARDALESIKIIKNHDIKIIGPTTDIRGLFHSPLFWYIISPFYFFSGGSPEIARIPMILINLVNIVFIYFFARKIFNNEKIALLSSLLMAVSFEAVQYARWLSNPPPALLTIGIFFYGFWLVLEKKKIGLPLMLLFWGLSVNFQFFLAYQVVFVIFAVIFLLIKDRKVIIESIKKYYWLYGLSFLSFSFYIAAQLKFKFQGLVSFLSFLTKSGKEKSNLLPRLVNFVNRLIYNLANNLTAQNIFIAKIILIFILGFVIYSLALKKKWRKEIFFLFVWLISPIIIYPLQRNDSYFLNIGNLYPLIILVVLMVFELKSQFKKIGRLLFIIAVGLITMTNIYLILDNNKGGESLFSVQYKQNLADELKIIDYLYQSSNKKIFAVNTLTNPLYINTTWTYLFDWYGKKKYGYMPVWWGAYLDDFGKEIKFSDEKKLRVGDKLYLVIEPPVFHDDYFKAYVRFDNTRSTLLKKLDFNTHKVEERKINLIKGFSRDELTDLLQIK